MKLAALAAAVAAICSSPARATVNSTCPPVTYVGNGVTTAFTFPCRFLASGDLIVTVGGIRKSIGLDYSVTGAGATSGTVTFIAAPPVAASVVLSRNVDNLQKLSIRGARLLDTAALENEIDKLAMAQQQFAGGVVANSTTPGLISVADWNRFNQTAFTSINQFQQIGTGAVSRPLGGKAGERLSACDFEDPILPCPNGTDDTVALQVAWNAAVAQQRKLFIPRGTWRISSGINFSATFLGMSLEGEDENGTIILAVSPMTSMFTFSASATQNFRFANFTLDGGSVAQYGINGPAFAYGKFDKVRVRFTTTSGAFVQNGWDTVFRDCEFINNLGDGIELVTPNDTKLENCLVANNNGWGLTSHDGGPVTIRGGAFESNAIGAIYSSARSNPLLVDAVYFEANGQTGDAFATPVKTVHSDIVLNGSGAAPTAMSHAFPNRTATVRNCTFTNTFTEAAIYAVAVDNLIVTGNMNSGTAVPLVKTWADTTFATVSNVRVSGNAGFLSSFATEGAGGAGGVTSRSIPFSTWKDDTAPLRNYIEKSGFLYPKIFGSAGTVIQRGATKFNGRETVDVTGTAGDEFGVAIDTSVTTELSGALVYISAWAKTSAATTSGPAVCIGGKCNTASFAVDTAYHFIEFADVLPASTSTLVGFKKFGATAGDTITYADVTVAVVGAPATGFQRNLLTPSFSTTAVPSAGTWATGDIVYNVAPVLGGPSGWVCASGGSPGSWVTLGPAGIASITLSAGAATATVASGCKCMATDSTAAAAVKCSVSGTTATFAGTGSDVINYTCF